MFLDIETSYHETGHEPQRVIIERSDFQSSQPASSEAERAIALNQERFLSFIFKELKKITRNYS